MLEERLHPVLISRPTTGPPSYTVTASTFPDLHPDESWEAARSNYTFRSAPGSMSTVRRSIERAALRTRETGSTSKYLGELYQLTGTFDRSHPVREGFSERRRRIYKELLNCRADSLHLAGLTTGISSEAHRTAVHLIDEATNIFLSQTE